MGLIVDTNALSAAAEGEPRVALEFTRARTIAIPAIVLGEYRYGIAQSRHKNEYERWLNELIAVSRVLDVNEETAMHYAEVRLELRQAGTPIPSNDLWIAALCRQHALPILSRDQHFDLIKGLHRRSW